MSDFLILLELVLKEGSPNGIYNVSTGEGKSIKEVYDVISNYLNVKTDDPPLIPVGDDDIKNVVLDSSYTNLTFGWKAKVNFKETIIKQLDWYEKYGVSSIYSHLNNQNK